MGDHDEENTAMDCHPYTGTTYQSNDLISKIFSV